MRIPSYRLFSVVLLAGLTALAPALGAVTRKSKTATPGAKDQIQVVGHIPLIGGPVIHFLTTQHYSRYYLYAEHDSGKTVTLIDVTKMDRPAVLADLPYPPDGSAASVTLVAGTAALVTSNPVAVTSLPTLQTIKIMDFSDPKNPQVAREFTGVTAMGKDEGRGLVFVANAEGIWILQQQLAVDPEVEEEYSRQVFYNH